MSFLKTGSTNPKLTKFMYLSTTNQYVLDISPASNETTAITTKYIFLLLMSALFFKKIKFNNNIIKNIRKTTTPNAIFENRIVLKTEA